MRDADRMRTTLEIDEDLLVAAKELAAARGTTAGRVVSDLLRAALAQPSRQRSRNGIPLLPRRPAGSRTPTMKLVNDLRD